MKLVRCEWAPSLVVEWLCGELEERGIPGPTYAHTLLSLLHHHYCPHPAPPTPIATTCSSKSSGHYHHPLSRRHLDDFDLRDLDLDDLLGHTPHPDADLPEISLFTPQQRGGSRRARKRFKVRQKQRVLTSEQLQKVAAIQCLMSASDERYDLESLVEELCTRLKTAAESKHRNATKSNPAGVRKEKVDELANFQESSNESEEYASSSTPEEQAEKYYAAFPPLSGSCKENCTHEVVWRSGDPLCSCIWEGRKLTSVPTTSKMPRAYRKKCREKEKRIELEGKAEGKDSSEGSRRQHVSFTWHAAAKHKDAIKSESYDTDSASEAERVVERRRKRFIGPLLDEDIGEGYIGDTSSRESSEDRDKGDQEAEKLKDDRQDKVSSVSSCSMVKLSQEEWECMGDILMKASNTEGNKMQDGGGNRLFERGSTSGGTSGSSSDIETFAVASTDQEAECVRQLERKISDSVAQVWGQAGESLGHGRGEHVWDPPAMQEMTFYTTNWGFELPDQYISKDSVGVHQCQNTDRIEEQLPSVSNKWQQKKIWQSGNPITQGNPLLCSSTSQNSPNKIQESNGSDAHFELNSSMEKSVWSDCNANNISGGKGPIHSREDPIDHTTFKSDHWHAVCEVESALCESYLKLGLENLWENTLGLESIFADLSLSNSNEEYISGNQSFEEIHNNHTDSEHEKMMALVEDVCKSYESQEENALENSLLKQVPTGPSGPQADLKHTENSGFSMVLPRGKSAELPNNGEQLPENLLLGLENSITPGDISRSMDTLPPGQEEENLLTSPRTHFRPIRQESLGSTADDHYEDGTMFIINSERPDLPFQRTSSGALFLESDLLEGSPKKYMVYKEPPPKIIQVEEPEPLSSETVLGIALVPKFKVVNNEKFCQTEEEIVATVQTFGNRKDRLSLQKHAFVDRLMCDDEDDQDPDVFEFQHQDFSDESSLAHIWKNDSHSHEAQHTRNIWQVQVDGEPDAWSLISDVEQPGSASHDEAWIEKENEGATAWINENSFQVPLEIGMSKKSGAVVIPTSLASLWHHSSSPSSPSDSASLHQNLEALWAGFKPPYNDEALPDSGRSRMYIITNPNTHIPGKMQESCQMMSLAAEIGPWKHLSSLKDHNPRENFHEEKLFMSSHLRLHSSELGDEKREGCVDPNIENPAVCTKLRLEVDQEADELLGAVHAQTASEIPPPFANPTVFSSVHNRLSCNPSPRPLHERMKKCSSFSNSTKKNNEHVIDCGSNKEREEEREDLDDLAPGWEFNDGFEWEHQPPNADEEEDCADAIIDDDDGEGSEVLVYETADGTTYSIPIEYLDDSLYDQIFGTTTENKALGGSLPDLPSGQPNKIHFSSELEEEWKKSGIPYKVQLPRKHRPGRWLPPSRRPCTFFMEGSCRRSDCKFSHDLASITCRFWEEGSCLKGITCPFLHGYPVRRRRNKSEGATCSLRERHDQPGSSFEIDSEMDFPTLGSSCESKSGFAEERISTSGGSNSHHLATKRKKRKFITITKNVLGEVRSAEAERALRKRLPTRRERRRRHADAIFRAAEEATVPSISTESSAKQRNANSRRKAERHRASASGHDDGTVSDY